MNPNKREMPQIFGEMDRAGIGPSMNTRAKQQQPLEASGLLSTMRRSPATGTETRADPAEDVQRRENNEAEIQKDGGSSKPGGLSIWDTLARKATIGNQVGSGWATKSANWRVKPWNEQRHNQVGWAASSSWNTNSWNKPRGDASRSFSSKGTWHGTGTRPLNNQQNTVRPYYMNQNSLPPLDQQNGALPFYGDHNFQPPWNQQNDARPFYWNQNFRAPQNQHNTSQTFYGNLNFGPQLPQFQSPRQQRPSDHCNWDISKTKPAHCGIAEVRTKRPAEDGSGQALLNQHAQRGSSQEVLAVTDLRGNVDVTRGKRRKFTEWQCDTIGLGCDRRQNLGNQGILALCDPSAAFVSTPPSLTAEQATDCSVSVKEMNKGGQPSNKIEGVVRVDKGYIYPTVSSGGVAERAGIIYTTKRALCTPSKVAQAGPALAIIWKGNFEIPEFPRIRQIFVAHPAVYLSSEAYDFAGKMAGKLQFNLQPRDAFWPDIFKEKCPDNGDIALYFYPQTNPRAINMCAMLQKELEEQNRMLRSVMDGVELLVFSSSLLDPKYQKLDGNLYLWGVFRKL